MLHIPIKRNNATHIAIPQQFTATMGHVSPHVRMEPTSITPTSTAKPVTPSVRLAHSVQLTAPPAPQHTSTTTHASVNVQPTCMDPMELAWYVQALYLLAASP